MAINNTKSNNSISNVRKEISYERFNHERWLMSIGFNNVVTVFCNGEMGEYKIPEPIVRIKHDTEYVFLYVESNKFYQFKFEDGNFLVGDIFDNEGEHIDSFASHVFGEI